jgi:hypothetical protein
VIRQVELAPLVGAPISISWDDFPGLTVRVGRWHEESYPQCGCDACDEGPAELVEELLRQVETVVAGKFIEAVVSDADGVWLTFEILAPDGRVSGKRLLRDGHPALKYPGEIRWPAWPSSAVPTK